MIPIYVNGKKLLYFNELSKESAINAINCILLDESRYLEKKISQYKVKTLNDKINNKHDFRRLKDRKKHYAKLLMDFKYLNSFIEANLCMFFDCGTYYRFYKD